jgi:cytochrome c biogenesis protein ResB
LLAVGIVLVLLAIVGGVRGRPRAAVVVTALAGGLVIGIARAPLDCSIRFEYCEKLVTADFASDSHLVHVVLAGVLTLLTVVAAALLAHRRRSWAHLLLAGTVTISAAIMFAAPTVGYLGSLQLVTLAGGGWATVRLWLATPTLSSPP